MRIQATRDPWIERSTLASLPLRFTPHHGSVFLSFLAAMFLVVLAFLDVGIAQSVFCKNRLYRVPEHGFRKINHDHCRKCWWVDRVRDSFSAYLLAQHSPGTALAAVIVTSLIVHMIARSLGNRRTSFHYSICRPLLQL